MTMEQQHDTAPDKYTAELFRDATTTWRRWRLATAATTGNDRIHLVQVGADRLVCGSDIAAELTAPPGFQTECRLCTRALIARTNMSVLLAAFDRGWLPTA